MKKQETSTHQPTVTSLMKSLNEASKPLLLSTWGSMRDARKKQVLRIIVKRSAAVAQFLKREQSKSLRAAQLRAS
jgi:hypothetical protein